VDDRSSENVRGLEDGSSGTHNTSVVNNCSNVQYVNHYKGRKDVKDSQDRERETGRGYKNQKHTTETGNETS